MSDTNYSWIQVKVLIEMLQAIDEDKYISIKVNTDNSGDPQMDIDNLEHIEVWNDWDATCTLFISK